MFCYMLQDNIAQIKVIQIETCHIVSTFWSQVSKSNIYNPNTATIVPVSCKK